MRQGMRRGALLLGLLAGGATLAAEGTGDALRIGVLAPEGAEEAEADWSRLAAQLRAALPGQRVQLESFDLPGLRGAVAAARIDFFIANSGFYVAMESEFGATRIATLESPPALSPAQGIAAAVIVRNDRRELQRFADLKGRRLLAVGEQAFGGYQLAWREMARAGFDPRQDPASLQFSGYPLRRIVHAVQRGDADAGIIRACLLERLIARGQLAAGELRVLNEQPAAGYPCRRSTPLYPDWPFAALRGTPHALAKEVATALLAMPAAPGDISWTVPTDYQPVHELFRELQIGPYAHLAEPSFAEWLRRYWWGVALALLLLLGSAVHTLRVEVLVARRTRELRAALAARDHAEATAREREAQLEHLARLGILGEMASMLAHELAQPLAAIGNFARGLERRIAGGRDAPAALREGAQAIATQAERAAQVIERIRSFARKRAITRQRIELGALVDESVAMFLAIVGRGPTLRIERAAGAESGLRIAGDPLQLQQVLLNLLKNAYDALREAPPERREIVVGLGREGNRARITVVDRGPPIDPAHAARFFEPFFTTKPDGVGLGLAICQRAIEAHGGHIAASADPSGGLAVVIDLPLHPDP